MKCIYVLSLLAAVASMAAEPATLSQQLEARRKKSMEKSSPEVVQTMADAQRQLRESGILDRVVKAGDRAPLFELPDQDGQKVAIFEALEKGPVVVVFYRGGWCPYCNLQLKAMQQVLPELESLGAKLVAVSPQKAEGGREMAGKDQLGFSLLVDANNAVARAYGLMFSLSPGLEKLYQSFGIDLKAENASGKADLPLAATYVIAPGGMVAYSFVDVAYYRRAEPAEVVAAVRKLMGAPPAVE